MSLTPEASTNNQLAYEQSELLESSRLDTAIDFCRDLGHNALRGITTSRVVRGALALGLAVGAGTAVGVASEMADPRPQAAVANGGYPDWEAPCVANDENKTTGTGYWCSNYDWGYYTRNPEGQINGRYTNSSRGYGYRNCTDWVAWRVPQLIQTAVPKQLGHAHFWNDNAPAGTVDTTPEPGDIAAWEIPPGQTFGHVAVVESVNPDGTVNISEYNKGRDGVYGTRPNVTANHYIDLNGTGKGINGEDLTTGGGTGSGADAFADFVIHRPTRDGIWSVKKGPSGNSYDPHTVYHGNLTSDVPLIGDFNNDNKDDFVIYRQGMWYVKDKNGNFIGPGANGLSHGGWAEDIPLVGDLDGNGYDDFILYRPSWGRFVTKYGPNGAGYLSDVSHGGHPGDVPLIGDYNNDGKDDLVIYRPSNGLWGVRPGPGGTLPNGATYIGPGSAGLLHGGWSGDVPLVGDFSGDGIDDFIIYRPAEGRWITKLGPTGATYLSDFPHGGWAGDIPLVGDVDGSGTDDAVIYRPSWGRFVSKKGPGGSEYISDVQHGGWDGDRPMMGNVS